MANDPPDIYQRITAIATAVGTLFLGVAALVAAFTYYADETRGRLQRTLKILEVNEDEWQNRNALLEYPDRWKPKITRTMSPELAGWLYQVADHPDWKDYHRWNVARKHLNELVPFAFAYVHNLADREIIAAASCVYMTKSYQYFESLIKLFGDQLGSGQSWQVIKQAVGDMTVHFVSECEIPGSLERRAVPRTRHR